MRSRAASARSAPNTVRGDWTSPGLATPLDESAPKYAQLAGCVLLLLQHYYIYCFSCLSASQRAAATLQIQQDCFRSEGAGAWPWEGDGGSCGQQS